MVWACRVYVVFVNEQTFAVWYGSVETSPTFFFVEALSAM